MERPDHLTSAPPAATFRMIATWAEQAAQRVEAGEDAVIECTFIWAAIVHAHPEVRPVLKRGLDRAQIYTGEPRGTDSTEGAAHESDADGLGYSDRGAPDPPNGGPAQPSTPAPHYVCPDHARTGGYEPCCNCGGWADDDPQRGRMCSEAES